MFRFESFPRTLPVEMTLPRTRVGLEAQRDSERWGHALGTPDPVTHGRVQQHVPYLGRRFPAARLRKRFLSIARSLFVISLRDTARKIANSILYNSV